MPEYDYTCRTCGKLYAITMHISDHDTYTPRCPSCGSTDCDQQFLSINIKRDHLSDIQLP